MKPTAIMAGLICAMAGAVGVIAAPGHGPANGGSPMAAAAVQAGEYRVTRAIKLPDDGRYWNSGITIDGQGKIMYLLEGPYTLIADAATGKEIAKISTCWSNGVALVPEVNRGFVSTGQWGVIVFDLKTHAQIGKLDLHAALGGMIYDTFSKRLLVITAPHGALTPIAPDIDLKTGKPEAPIQFQGEVRGMVSDGKGMVYATVTGNDNIGEHVAVLDTRTMTIAATWLIPEGAGQATGISMDRVHSRLFVSCAGKLAIMSATDGHALAVLPVGKVSGGWVGSGVTAYADGKVFASCGDRTFTVVGQDAAGKFVVERQLDGVGGVTAFAVNPVTGEVYVPTLDEAKQQQPAGFKVMVAGKK